MPNAASIIFCIGNAAPRYGWWITSWHAYLSASKLSVANELISIAAREMLNTASATGISFGSAALVSLVSDSNSGMKRTACMPFGSPMACVTHCLPVLMDTWNPP